jgi:tetratricopeptide (TPR) repeat protein
MTSQLTPDIDALPFLVRHGGWFWIVLVVLFALAIVGLVALVRHIKAIFRTRADLASVRTQLSPSLAEGKVALAGRWSKDSIIVGGERVKLDEGWRVIVGTRHNQIADGAEVIVRGELVREATTESEGHSYRDNAGGWCIKNGEAYATRPRVRAQPMPWAARIVGIVAALVASLITLRIVGGVLNDRIAKRDYRNGDGQPLSVGQLDMISIASSLPGTRDKALEHLVDALEQHPYRDDASVRRQLALASLVDGPCKNLWILRARPEEQLAWAKRCGYRKTVFDLQVSLGLYEDAWNNRPPNLDAPERLGMLAIATSHWPEAAEQADKMAEWYESEASKGSDMQKLLAADALRFLCLAQWFRTLGGEQGGADKLRQIAEAPGNPPVICAPIVAQTLPVSERVAYLERALAAPDPDDEYRLQSSGARWALWLEGEDSRPWHFDAFDIAQAVGNGDLAVRGWVFQFGVETWQQRNDRRNEALALGGVLLREVHRGDFAAAHRALDEATRLARAANDEITLHSVHEWSEYLAIREGLIELPAPSYVDTYLDVLKLRRGEPAQMGLAGFPESCNDRLAAAVAAAQRGDGRPLASAMHACEVYSGFGISTLLGVLPRVTEGRAELAGALRWWDDMGSLGAYEPFSNIAYAAAHRDIARFVGDNESAERWGEMAKRLTLVLEDRTRTVALILWHN